MDDILAGVQDIADSFMLDEVTITNRLPSDADPENPFGDDTVEWESSSTTVNGWLVGPATKSLDDTGGMSVVVNEMTLRLPVGTFVNRGAKVVLARTGAEYSVVGDPTDDETWPAMIKVAIAREQ